MTHSPEPWTIQGEISPKIIDAKGKIVADPVSNEDGMEDDDRERIVACVNACQGYSTEALERYAKSLEPIRFDCPYGDIHAQAMAWQAVWNALWDAGMCSFLGTMSDGKTRAVEFIQHMSEASRAMRGISDERTTAQ